MNITINSSVEHLFNEGLISATCKDVLKSLDVVDVFDIMTTKYPEEEELISCGNLLFNDPPIFYKKEIKKEIDVLVNKLYTSQELTLNP